MNVFEIDGRLGMETENWEIFKLGAVKEFVCTCPLISAYVVTDDERAQSYGQCIFLTTSLV